MIFRKKADNSPKPKNGDKKTKKRFAFFPKTLENGDIVWLQFYKKHYRYQMCMKTHWFFGAGGLTGHPNGHTWDEMDWAHIENTIS